MIRRLIERKIENLLENNLEEEGGFVSIGEASKSISVKKLKNIDPNKNINFSFNIKELYDQLNGAFLLFFWHTHVKEESEFSFTKSDISFSENWMTPSIIFSKRKSLYFFPRKRNIFPIEKRWRVEGIFDCWTLVVDKLMEQGIYIDFFPTENPFEIKDMKSALAKYIKNNSLLLVEKKDVRENDFFISICNNKFHCGVFLDENTILHHTVSGIVKEDFTTSIVINDKTSFLRKK